MNKILLLTCILVSYADYKRRGKVGIKNLIKPIFWVIKPDFLDTKSKSSIRMHLITNLRLYLKNIHIKIPKTEYIQKLLETGRRRGQKIRANGPDQVAQTPCCICVARSGPGLDLGRMVLPGETLTSNAYIYCM